MFFASAFFSCGWLDGICPISIECNMYLLTSSAIMHDNTHEDISKISKRFVLLWLPYRYYKIIVIDY